MNNDICFPIKVYMDDYNRQRRINLDFVNKAQFNLETVLLHSTNFCQVTVSYKLRERIVFPYLNKKENLNKFAIMNQNNNIQLQNNQQRRPQNTFQRTQNVIDQSINAFNAVQQYNDLVEGGNLFTELRSSEISNSQFSDMLFSGVSFT
ncbi:6415_t:CDS:2 [Dentiscutata erythropus]|uniref:6415_t:CDS:1 n=1 Tax=Dentiscutata erythropus TaxID=1348616 RepID=A0A9N9F8Z6_9GLOM|nr:6415_t:CDS:2 [Dentiscutata erythropus]